MLSRTVLLSLQPSKGEPVLAVLALLMAGVLSHHQQQAVALLNTKEVVAFLVTGSDNDESFVLSATSCCAACRTAVQAGYPGH